MDELFTLLQTALGDRYAIEREIGRGGMAVVFLAHDLKHHRRVALKVVRPELAAAVGAERFLREIQIAAGLQHTNIVPLFDSGEAEGALYYVMPYIEGESLRARLEREGQLPLADAIQIAREVAAALSHAHSHGVVHRDVKPENILLSGGQAFVADFGIARAITAAGGERLTDSGIAVGTPAYMSPEQASAEHVIDGRSDVYSLGCVLYEMIAGEPPFTGSSAQAILARKLTDPVPPLRTVRHSVPEAVERVILEALARVPADRLATASRFADALEQATATPDRRKRRWLARVQIRTVLIAALAGSVVLGGAAWLWARQSGARWARAVGLPQAMRLLQQGKTFAAYRILRQARTSIPDDPLLNDLWTEATKPVTIRTTPPAGQVYVRDFADDSMAWEYLGSAPLTGLRLPFGQLVFKTLLPGFQTQEELRGTLMGNLAFSLPRADSAPFDMVRIPGGRLELFSTPAVELDGYWIDRYEVTNRQFKEFVDRGGYEKSVWWTGVFLGEDMPHSWNQFRQTFRDRTGRPGPATWELGTYPDGQEDYPVGGVSWYEAVAYCASVGKQLPTIYHWYQAANPWFLTDFAHYGKFSAPGPARVGQPLHLGVYGTYDMAGNIKEWAWNQAAKGQRYILGGAWNEPSYYFFDYDAQRPSDRQPTYGIRCARSDAPVPATLKGPVYAPSRDYRRETPVSDAAFAVYRSLYRYDRTPLAATVDSVDDHAEHWRVELVSFNTAYANERVPAILFLPRGTPPPYQTVVWVPGGNAFSRSSRAGITDIDEYWFLFLVRSGHAVVVPIYKGTYERHFGDSNLPQIWRDLMIYVAKDLGRTIDYLGTRADIDTSKLAYYGFSMGAGIGPIVTAVDSRFKASILLGGGLYAWRRPPEAEALNFLPRVKVPTLMINGRYDFYFSPETSQDPMFRLLGAAPADKRHLVFESGHVPKEREEVIKAILDWLDRYLGPVTQR